MTKSLYLEVLNGYVFVLAVWASIMFCRYLWIDRYSGYRELRPALAVATLVFGEMIRSGSYWYIRHNINVDRDINVVPPLVLAFAGSALLGWGIFCCIRVFSPVSTNHRYDWLIAIMLATIWSFGWIIGDYWF